MRALARRRNSRRPAQRTISGSATQKIYDWSVGPQDYPRCWSRWWRRRLISAERRANNRNKRNGLKKCGFTRNEGPMEIEKNIVAKEHSRDGWRASCSLWEDINQTILDRRLILCVSRLSPIGLSIVSPLSTKSIPQIGLRCYLIGRFLFVFNIFERNIYIYTWKSRSTFTCYSSKAIGTERVDRVCELQWFCWRFQWASD